MGNVPTTSISSQHSPNNIDGKLTPGIRHYANIIPHYKNELLSKEDKRNYLQVSKSFINFQSSASDVECDMDHPINSSKSKPAYRHGSHDISVNSRSMTDLSAGPIHGDVNISMPNKSILTIFRNKLTKKRAYLNNKKGLCPRSVTQPSESGQVTPDTDRFRNARLSIRYGYRNQIDETSMSNGYYRSSLASGSTVVTSPGDLAYQKPRNIDDSSPQINISRSTSEIERTSIRQGSTSGFLGILNVKKRLSSKYNKGDARKRRNKSLAFSMTPKSLSSPRRSNIDASRLAEGFFRRVSLNDEESSSTQKSKLAHDDSSLAFMNKNFLITPDEIDNNSESASHNGTFENVDNFSGNKVNAKNQLILPSSSSKSSHNNQLEKINETFALNQDSWKLKQLEQIRKHTISNQRKKSIHTSMDDESHSQNNKLKSISSKNLTKSLSCYALKFFHANSTTHHMNTNVMHTSTLVPSKVTNGDRPRLHRMHNIQSITDRGTTILATEKDSSQDKYLSKYRSVEEMESRRTVIIQTSTSELLKCLSYFIADKCSHLIVVNNKSNTSISGGAQLRRRNDSIGFQPVAIIAWIRCIDRALLVQGWSDTAFINPANVIFFYMLLKDYVNESITSEYTLHSVVMACLYLSYAYMGNEISYPLKPFLNAEINNSARSLRKLENRNKRSLSASVTGNNLSANPQTWNNSFNDEHLAVNRSTDQERDRFWARCLNIMNEKSTDMLRINSDAKLFTNLFNELKAYGITNTTADANLSISVPIPPARTHQCVRTNNNNGSNTKIGYAENHLSRLNFVKSNQNMFVDSSSSDLI